MWSAGRRSAKGRCPLPPELLPGEAASIRPERVELDTPPGPASTIARLVLGGIAERLRLGFEELDDVQLALERLLAEAGSEQRVHVSFEWTEQILHAYVGPLREAPIAAALEGPEGARGELGLRRILETVVDSFAIEQVDGDGPVVRLDKLVRRS